MRDARVALGLLFVAALLVLSAVEGVRADDWSQWGGHLDRNMVADETGLPSSFDLGQVADAGGWKLPPSNVKWSARLGTQTYGTPVVAGGRVFVGTNNNAPRNTRRSGDRLVLMAFDEADGTFEWQLAAPRRRQSGKFLGSVAGLGICAAAAVDGDRVYVVTGRCDVVCMDVKGLGKARKPIYGDESEYLAAPVSERISGTDDGPQIDLHPGAPVELSANDANIVWVFDMMKQVRAWPHEASDSSILISGDYLYVGTSNGMALDHRHIPSPSAPSLIVLDKRTGKLVAKDNAGIGPRVFHGQWSSPSMGTVNGKSLVFYGGGDGYCYAFAAEPGVNGKPGVLRKVWSFDGDPPEYRVRNGKRLPYKRNGEGPSEIIATPVFYRNRVYVAVGQDPRHGFGKGCLSCIDATKTGDISSTGAVWRYTDIGRSLSTVAIADGLVYCAELNGTLHCLDAETGKVVWKQDLASQVWASPLVADGKVYIGTERGDMWILKACRQKQVLARIPMHGQIYTSAVAANGVLYVATHKWLYALKNK